MMRLALLSLLALFLQGCFLFGGDDEEKEPAKLVDFQPTQSFKRLWSVKIGDNEKLVGVRLRPAFAAGRVYAATSDGAIKAVDAANGRVLWSVKSRLPISAGPGVGEGLLLVGTIDGEVVAFGAESGEERWRVRVSSEVLASPAIHNGMVVVRSQDGRVFGFEAQTARREWIFDRSVPRLTLRGNSPPAVRGGFAFLGFDSGRVVSLRVADGSLAWEQSVALPGGRTELDRIVDIDGPITVVASDLYAVSYQGRLASLTADSGRLLWVRDFSSHSGIAVGRAQLFVSDTDDAVWGLDRLSGGTLWKQDRLARRAITAPVRVGDSVVVGDFDGYLHALSAEEGNFTARVQADGSGLASAPLAVGQELYVLGASGKLSAFRLE